MSIAFHVTSRRPLPLLALAATLALAACKKDNDANAATTAATPSVTVGPENVAVARQQEIQSGPTISGSLAPEKEARLSAEVPGAVVQTMAEAGQRVTRGQLLARIDDAAIQQALLSARSTLASAQTAASNAERELQRARTLVQAGAIAERDLESATTASTGAQAQLAAARAQVAAAQQNMDRTRITAPFTGVVAERRVSAGDVVAPGMPLFTVVEPGSMRLEASVPAEQLSAVRLGAPVSFTVSGYPGREFTGRITRVSPVADPTTRQVQILATIPNAGNSLVGGLFAEGRIASESRSGLVIPANAINERGIAPTARRLKGGVVEEVTVQLGLRDQGTETVEITAGLAAGDTVLVGAAQGISAGTKVTIGRITDRASR
jgi:membrane fusion protein, multidrug efflux system